MTNVVFLRDPDALLNGFSACGHAGFGEYGSDIVCAAISALTQTAVIGLSKVACAPALIKRNDSKGFFSARVRSYATLCQRRQADLLLKTLLLGLKAIAAQYPGQLQVKIRKWR